MSGPGNSLRELVTSSRGGALGPFAGPGSRLSDVEIRAALLREIGTISPLDCQALLPEVECWRGHVRADYVFVSGDLLSVVEIKSDRDNMRRFGEQVRVYNAIADRVLLVVGWTLAAQALAEAPWWWDVVLAERDPAGDVRFIPLRDGVCNREVAAVGLAAMLPVDELRRLAAQAGLNASRSRGTELRTAVSALLSLDQLRNAVRDWVVRLSHTRASSSRLDMSEPIGEQG